MKSSTDMTSIARLHAKSLDLERAVGELALDSWVQVGDVIEMNGAAGKEAFIVRSRRVIVAVNGLQKLVFTLDYPPYC